MVGNQHVLTALPAPRSSFLGRDDELEHLLAQTRRQNLVTVVGPGGIGKTRLALALADRLVQRRTRVGFVELADVGDPSIVLDVIADQLAVEVVPQASREDGVVHLLAAAPTVLVIDNFEHVIGAAPEISKLLEACPDLCLVLTSRRPLHLPGEYVLSVSPLAARAPDHAPDRGKVGPGVQLLLDRSNADAVSPPDVAAAARIVDGLGGLPLAIELAARRVSALGFTAVYELLVADLALDGFRTESEDTERHRSLRDCLEWTFRDLGDGAQAALRATGAFAGTFDLAALQAVVGDQRRAATGLATLVEHSLVERTDTGDGTVRYTSIPPIREFARELLSSAADRTEIVDAHAHWYASVARRIRDRFERVDADAALDEFRRENANINHAIAELRSSGQLAEAVAMSCAVAKLAVELGRESRVNEWFVDVARIALAEKIELPYEALIWAAFADLVTHGPSADRPPTAALDDLITQAHAAGDERAALRGLERIAYSVMAHGDLVRGLTAAQEAIDVSARLGLKWHHAQLLILRAMGLHVIGEIAEASRLGFQGLRIARELNASRLVIRVGLLFAPMTRTAEMDVEQVPGLEACYEIAKRAGSVLDEMYVVMQLSVGAGFEGNPRVFEFAGECYALADRTRSFAGELVPTLGLASAAFNAGDDDIANVLDRGLRLQWSALTPVIPRRALERYEAIVTKRRDAVGAKGGEPSAHTSTTMWSETVALARRYAAEKAEPPDSRGPDPLTEREREVLTEIAAGRTNKEIAARLGIHPKTVMHHSSAIYRKLGVKTRAEAAATALRSGILDVSPT
ncbi:MAG TPA: LuxR C-terminal-related transcriptional regulator [Acidimicrobiia bacterium]|nr:LuxR C-terminal-related transcriptional regulator [Acidimicrobiia bacterium]